MTTSRSVKPNLIGAPYRGRNCYTGMMKRHALFLVTAVIAATCEAQHNFPAAVRFSQNPLITVQTSKSLGDDINGPAVVRVPAWVQHPLGLYYLYFAHHRGTHIRMAYADSLQGPWKIYEPGVLSVRETIFTRPQPDPPNNPLLYTHVASPELLLDEQRKQFVLYVHGMWTDGKRWPQDPGETAKWLRMTGYAQYTQTAVSNDGLHFSGLPGITVKTSYLRVFPWHGAFYGMARLGVLGIAKDPRQPFELGPNPFDGGPYAARVRHVAVMVRGNKLNVFFSAIGDAPERILLSSIDMAGDWKNWKATLPVEVLAPKESYECADLSIVTSKIGEAEGRERALRDPAVFQEDGRVFLFYSICGEQGIAAADITSFVKK